MAFVEKSTRFSFFLPFTTAPNYDIDFCLPFRHSFRIVSPNIRARAILIIFTFSRNDTLGSQVTVLSVIFEATDEKMSESKKRFTLRELPLKFERFIVRFTKRHTSNEQEFMQEMHKSKTVLSQTKFNRDKKTIKSSDLVESCRVIIFAMRKIK